MVACLRSGYVAFPCTEQLRAHDLAVRLAITRPAAIVCDERNRGELEAARPECPVLLVPDAGAARPRARRRCAAGARSRRRRARADHLHERHRRRAEGRRARPALPARPGAPGRALARRPPGRARVVHGCERLEQVGPQRVHRAVAARRSGAAPRRALRRGRAAGDPRSRGRRRALHGADRVPRDRQARAAPAGPGPAVARRGRRAARRGRARRVPRGDRPLDPRRLRADGDRPDDGPGRRPAAGRRIDGAALCPACACGSPTRSCASTR